MSLIELVQACNDVIEEKVVKLAQIPSIRQHINEFVDIAEIDNSKYKIKNKTTALFVACLYANYNIVKILLDSSAKVDVKDGNGDYVIHCACSSDIDALPKVKAVIGMNRSEIDRTGWNEWTPLHVASMHGSCDVVEYLLENGADITAVTDDGLSPLHAASSCKTSDVTKCLLSKGANINATDNNGRGPLHLAAIRKAYDVLNCLLDNGADVNALACNEWTPLHDASRRDDPDVVRCLLNHGANIKALSNDGCTALHIAASKNHTAVMQVLINWSANINQQNSDGDTALHMAAECAKLEAVKFLTIQPRCDISIRNNKMRTASDVATSKPKKWNTYDDVIEFFKTVMALKI